MVSSVGTNENLNKVGREQGLQNLINDNPGRIALRMARLEGVAPLTMAGTVEAILGAVYMDGGMEPVAGVMQKLGIMAPTIRRIGRKRRSTVIGRPSERSTAESKAPSKVSAKEVQSSA